ncbi:MAG TPA: pilus assembly protein TadG-related protein [Candidatus Binataceae bacterium]|nr:pilus assembly protein TadG-related protein [Candidatus Binataceae bacterium]
MILNLSRIIRQKQSGQTLVLITLSIVALVGFAGLATDIGYFYTVRRHMQTAADAAAVAAANQQSNGTAAQAAADVTSLNGFTNGVNNTTVTITNPTMTSPYPSGTYYKVVVSSKVPTYFLSVLGFHTMTVTTTALAGTVNGSSTILALNGSSSGITVDSGASVTVGGGGSVQGGCGVVSNAGMTNNGTITAPAVGVVTSVSGTQPANLHTNIQPVSDPLSNCSVPTETPCTRKSNTTGCNNITGTKTISTPKCLDGTGSNNSCGYQISSSGSCTVNFASGTYGDHISCGASTQPTCKNATINFGSNSKIQCQSTWGYGWGGSTPCSFEIGTNATGCTVNFSGTNNVFYGNVSIAGKNTVNLCPGTYYGGITVNGGTSSTTAPTVNFAPGNYIICGGGLQVSGTCTLSGTGCSFHNKADTSALGASSGPISCGGNWGDNVTCDLHAPTSGSRKGILCTQDSAITGNSGHGWWHGWGGSQPASQCSLQGNSSSHFDGACYFPGASLKYCGHSSSSQGYTVLVADSVELTNGSSTQVNCDYSSMTDHMSPIVTSALYN